VAGQARQAVGGAGGLGPAATWVAGVRAQLEREEGDGHGR